MEADTVSLVACGSVPSTFYPSSAIPVVARSPQLHHMVVNTRVQCLDAVYHTVHRILNHTLNFMLYRTLYRTLYCAMYHRIHHTL